MDVKIEQTWKEALQPEFEKPYFASLVRFLHDEKAAGKVIYPPGRQIFKAFELTPLPQVKAVILGQDPYHGPGQAMGLCFSVPEGVQAPPSLKNIFKEIHDDLSIPMSGSPDLEPWARQGVLLLNSVLTVQAGSPASHSRIGWQEFTDAVIKTVSDRCDGVVFLLWPLHKHLRAAQIGPVGVFCQFYRLVEAMLQIGRYLEDAGGAFGQQAVHGYAYARLEVGIVAVVAHHIQRNGAVGEQIRASLDARQIDLEARDSVTLAHQRHRQHCRNVALASGDEPLRVEQRQREAASVADGGQKVGDLTTRRVKSNINSESNSRQRAMGG